MAVFIENHGTYAEQFRALQRAARALVEQLKGAGEEPIDIEGVCLFDEVVKVTAPKGRYCNSHWRLHTIQGWRIDANHRFAVGCDGSVFSASRRGILYPLSPSTPGDVRDSAHGNALLFAIKQIERRQPKAAVQPVA